MLWEEPVSAFLLKMQWVDQRLGITGSLSEMQTLRPQPRPTEPDSAFECDSQVRIRVVDGIRGPVLPLLQDAGCPQQCAFIVSIFCLSEKLVLFVTPVLANGPEPFCFQSRAILKAALRKIKASLSSQKQEA